MLVFFINEILKYSFFQLKLFSRHNKNCYNHYFSCYKTPSCCKFLCPTVWPSLTCEGKWREREREYVCLYSNNVYKYSSSSGVVSSIRVLVCIWKTYYYYYCIINKEDVQSCLVSLCIMYVPLSQIKCNSRVLSWVLVRVFCICLLQVESFLVVYSSFLFGAAAEVGWETLYKFYLSVFVLLFPFSLYKLLE